MNSFFIPWVELHSVHISPALDPLKYKKNSFLRGYVPSLFLPMFNWPNYPPTLRKNQISSIPLKPISIFSTWASISWDRISPNLSCDQALSNFYNIFFDPLDYWVLFSPTCWRFYPPSFTTDRLKHPLRKKFQASQNVIDFTFFKTMCSTV